MPTSSKPIRWALLTLSVLIALYAVILGLFCLPRVQSEFLFMQRVNWPFPWHLNHPERFGLAPFKTRNLKLDTSDGVEIGAWHVLPRSIYKSRDFPSRVSIETFELALTERPTILYFHGNAGNRAAPYRTRTYSTISSILDCNVLAIDYRGFGDSTGNPSEEGLMNDGIAAWDYIYEKNGRKGEDIILLGHSMGTAVAAQLGAYLADRGISPRAIILIAPFTSLPELLLEFYLFQCIPLLGPLRYVPKLQEYFVSKMVYTFNSTEAVLRTTSPILIAHTVDDPVIPYSHSARLFNALRNQAGIETTRVEEKRYDGWGTIRSFNRAKGEVIWWEGINGGHNQLGGTEGTMDLIARVARL